MVKLTLRREWLEPDYTPGSLYEAPFEEMEARPVFDLRLAGPVEATHGNLEAFAHDLLNALRLQLFAVEGPVHLALSGGYDSRILAALMERAGMTPLYITDGEEEPVCSAVLDFLSVPVKRRYVHDLSRPDPYGVTNAQIDGFAPLYSAMRFFPDGAGATLVTGLGGGEWFSYPAADWFGSRKPRIPHDDLLACWLDTFPQYWPLPKAWASGYRAALNPYASDAYAAVAVRCRPEWLVLLDPATGLDAVRAAMLEAIDPALAPLGYMPHRYDWRLSGGQKDVIDMRYAASWVAQFHRDEWGLPSEMDGAAHACTLAGFARWCEQLTEDGAVLV
jgi:hypothetical protein